MDGPGVRVNVILPENLLTEIDRHVESHGLTRSGFLAEAAKKRYQQSRIVFRLFRTCRRRVSAFLAPRAGRGPHGT
jgi:metal-responsive CopG/Arc/MetJ family transcriptional regulator